jgi:hypothetical protein
MMAENGSEPSARAERIRKEFVQAHRYRYARDHKRRFGIDPPGLRVRRIAFLHDAEGEEEAVRRRRLLEARGAIVEEWWPGGEGDPPAGREIHGLLVTTASVRASEVRERVGAAVRAVLGSGAVVAIAPSSLVYLATDGCLTGRRAAFPPGDEAEMLRSGVFPAESALARDGRLLTCSLWEKLPDLVRGLLDLVHQTSPGEARDS